jgi:hypothetical protein
MSPSDAGFYNLDTPEEIHIQALKIYMNKVSLPPPESLKEYLEYMRKELKENK